MEGRRVPDEEGNSRSVRRNLRSAARVDNEANSYKKATQSPSKSSKMNTEIEKRIKLKPNKNTIGQSSSTPSTMAAVVEKRANSNKNIKQSSSTPSTMAAVVEKRANSNKNIKQSSSKPSLMAAVVEKRANSNKNIKQSSSRPSIMAAVVEKRVNSNKNMKQSSPKVSIKDADASKMIKLSNNIERRPPRKVVKDVESENNVKARSNKNVKQSSSKASKIDTEATNRVKSNKIHIRRPPKKIESDTKTENRNKSNVKQSSQKFSKAEKIAEKLDSITKANIDHMDISQILAMGESRQDEVKDKCQSASDKDSDFDLDSSDSEWEEVQIADDDNAATLPAEGIQITIEGENAIRKKSKKRKGIEHYLRLHLNKNRKYLQVDLHKVHLLCLLSNGMIINECLRSEDLMALALSILPSKQCYPPKHADLVYLERFLKWFCSTYTVNKTVIMESLGAQSEAEGTQNQYTIEKVLMLSFERKTTRTLEDLVMLFVVILRSLGLQVRLVRSLQPLPLKPPASDLLKPPREPDPEEPHSSKSKVSKGKNQNKNSKSTKKIEKNSKNATGNMEKKKGKTNKSDNRRKMISSDDEDEEENPVKGQNTWPEVFLEEEEKWVSVDLQSVKYLCDNAVAVKATQPISYVLAFGNNNEVKDVTRRYTSKWLTSTQKLRVEQEWWHDSLRPFRGRRTLHDKEEDELLDAHVLTQDIPKSIQQFKGHPLYCLQRHLLKFEAIYPPEPPPLAFINKEPIFPRECVQTLHSRELWIKQAKVVKLNETAYKIVKARPKYNRSTNSMLPCQPLELFGSWQTEDFVPPTAQNGVVPRNDYGNVELFLDKMLPKGTVHLKLAGLQRVAKKLGIDCASALTGFEFGCGGSRPVYDGFVVCEEFKDVLIDAWSQEQEQLEKKEEEKRFKRIRDNWARLLKGLLIREKLNRKYSFNLGGKHKSEDAADVSKAGPSKKRKTTK